MWRWCFSTYLHFSSKSDRKNPCTQPQVWGADSDLDSNAAEWHLHIESLNQSAQDPVPLCGIVYLAFSQNNNTVLGKLKLFYKQNNNYAKHDKAVLMLVFIDPNNLIQVHSVGISKLMICFSVPATRGTTMHGPNLERILVEFLWLSLILLQNCQSNNLHTWIINPYALRPI